MWVWGWAALVSGLVGTWLAGKYRIGWIINVISAMLWIPPLWGKMWSSIASSVISAIICIRNYGIGRLNNER